MRAKRVLLCFILSVWSLFTTCFANATLLHQADVRQVMTQLFDYHVDKKEMTTAILERSLTVYLANFDPNHSYLLEEEARPYVQPKEIYLKKMLKDYDEGRLSAYFGVNETIEESIARARVWRTEWNRGARSLVLEAKESINTPLPTYKKFASNLTELKNRHRAQFVALLALQGGEKIDAILQEHKEEKLVRLCEKQLTLLENQYLGVDESGVILPPEAREHHVVLRAIKALAHSLDAHTAYYSPDEALAMKVQLEKGMCGIGVVLHEGIEGVAIADIIKGGPAAKGGKLTIGDTIVEIDGQDVKHCSFRKVLEVLRGEEGSRTVLGIVRQVNGGTPQFLRIELTREKITIEDKRVDVSYEPYGDGIIGKITLYSFYEGEDGVNSEKDMRKAIDYLKTQGKLYGLVLDMRDNSGGFLSQAVRVSGLFIQSGVVVISKYSDGTMKYYRTLDGQTFYDGPLVVLVSKGSASATEIVAQALQDYGVAIVVGDERTYGKGTIQHQTITSDRSNSFFKVTIGRYYTVSGRSTQIEGVKSDIVIPTNLHYEEMGEAYLDFPLPADQIEAAYNDPLTDIDPYARKWFVKYYLPTLQKPVTTWQSMIPQLRVNSRKRIADNPNFQLFITTLQEESISTAHGSNDLQMEEAVNVVKDMIFLEKQNSPHFPNRG